MSYQCDSSSRVCISNVKVVVRIRPTNESELDDKFRNVTEAVSDHMLVFDPKIQRHPGMPMVSHRDISRRRYKDLKYAFDHVFSPSASNMEVFEQTTKNIVSGVLNGYNCSVFAYGATGAGKTHTMLGNEKEPGVIYYTMIDLYRRINEQKDEKNFDVAISYSEVYNEQVHDLLMPGGNLPIREDKSVGVIIAGLSLHKPKTADDLLRMLHFGNKNRTQHPTDANSESSRSHAVFQVFVNQREKGANLHTEIKVAKMCLVDLAGSERANHNTNRGARFREGANINRSLLALGNVINALADNKFKGHIPYRDSKLTRLLKDSLGGNCQTVMIAAVSPSSRSFEDTYNTLRYAERAKHIRAQLRKNIFNVDFHIINYKKHIQELEKENQELRRVKQKLSEALELKEAFCSPMLKQFKDKLIELFRTRKELRKKQMASDGAKRELQWKMSRKEKTIKRVQRLTDSMHVIGKLTRTVERMKRRISAESQSQEEFGRQVQEQDSNIIRMHSDAVAGLGQNKTQVEILDLSLREQSLETSLYDSHMYLAFVKKMARAQEMQASVTEKLITCLLRLVKQQQAALKSHNVLTKEMAGLYEQCCYLVEERGVAWTQDTSSPGANSQLHDADLGAEDICISEIIDIQLPKLIWQNPGYKKEGQRLLESSKSLPQRVFKGKTAQEPTRVPVAHKTDLVPQSQSVNQPNHKSETTSLPKAGTIMNAVEMLNASLDLCPLRRGCNHPASHDHEHSQDPVDSSRKEEAPDRETAGLGDKSKLPCEEENNKSAVGDAVSSKPTHTSTPLKEGTSNHPSNGEVLNGTFEVMKPALPNTPCINERKHGTFEVINTAALPNTPFIDDHNRGKTSANKASSHSSTPTNPGSDSSSVWRRKGSEAREKTTLPHKLQFLPKEDGHSWRQHRPRNESRWSGTKSLSKSSPSASPSLTRGKRPSPRSHLAADTSNSNIASPLVCQASSSPKTYADAVKSPVCPSPRTPDAQIRPAASTLINPSIVNSLRKHGMPSLLEAFSASKHSKWLGPAAEGQPTRREALRQIDSNTPRQEQAKATQDPDILQTGKHNSEELVDTAWNKAPKPGGKSTTNQTGGRRRKHRLLMANIKDTIRDVKKSGFPSGLELLYPDDKQAKITTDCPSYMQPTFAASQRTMRLVRDKLARKDTGSTVVKRLARKTPFSFSLQSTAPTAGKRS